MFRLLRLFQQPAAPPVLRTGKVTSWASLKGFGFIEDSESNESVFVHYRDVRADKFKVLLVGEAVEFELCVNDGKKSARKVTGPGGAAVRGK